MAVVTAGAEIFSGDAAGVSDAGAGAAGMSEADGGGGGFDPAGVVAAIPESLVGRRGEKG